jgi:hypothetical protein
MARGTLNGRGECPDRTPVKYGFALMAFRTPARAARRPDRFLDASLAPLSRGERLTAA